MHNLHVIYIRDKCHDCGVVEGQFHRDLCDVPDCPHCGEQRLSCQCPPRLRRRVRYISWPQHCAKCGEEWPDHFFVSDKEWRRTVSPEHREKILCHACFLAIRDMLELPPCDITFPPHFANAIEAMAHKKGISLDEAGAILQDIQVRHP
jgi:hypothetical protein